MKHKFCTECLSDTGRYYYLKTLYNRVRGVQVPSGLYQCENCLAVVADDIFYPVLRQRGHHIIKKLSGRIEE